MADKRQIMQNKGAIIKNDETAKQGQKICFYCARFFCAGYHQPHTRIVCSGILPQWDFLYFLMRNVKATDSCKKFKLHEVFKSKTK